MQIPTIIDLYGTYEYNRNLTLKLSVQNLMNRDYSEALNKLNMMPGLGDETHPTNSAWQNMDIWRNFVSDDNFHRFRQYVFLSYVNFIAGTKNEYFHFIQSTAIPVNFTILPDGMAIDPPERTFAICPENELPSVPDEGVYEQRLIMPVKCLQQSPIDSQIVKPIKAICIRLIQIR